MAITIVFAGYYLSQHSKSFEQAYNFKTTKTITTCIDNPSSDPLTAAIYLSVHNGLVISGLSRTEKLSQSYACLYGSDGKDGLSPIMPDGVVFAGLAQTILSAALIFLFLLGLRNYFRIK
jgi:hypothetical protein